MFGGRWGVNSENPSVYALCSMGHGPDNMEIIYLPFTAVFADIKNNNAKNTQLKRDE